LRCTKTALSINCHIQTIILSIDLPRSENTAGIDLLSPFAPLFALVDFQNLYAWNKKPLSLNSKTFQDYTILIPIFNSPTFFKNKEYMDGMRNRVTLCIGITDRQMQTFADDMEKEGYTVFRFSSHAQSPWHVFREVLDTAQHVLLREALPIVRSRYTIFLDGDSRPEGDLGRACATMEEQGYGLASVMVRPSQTLSWMEKIQDVEYQLAMVTRRFRPWLTSGACIIGRTEILRTVMEKHTTFFYGGDIEVGRLGKRFCTVCHLDLLVKTDVPSSFLGWFRQRTGWWAGSFRQGIVNFDKDLKKAPVWTLYVSLVVWGLLGLRWFDVSKYWQILPMLWGLYLCLNVLVGLRFKVDSYWLLAYPFYAMFQSLVLPPFGLFVYLRYAVKNHLLGRLKV